MQKQIWYGQQEITSEIPMDRNISWYELWFKTLDRSIKEGRIEEDKC